MFQRRRIEEEPEPERRRIEEEPELERTEARAETTREAEVSRSEAALATGRVINMFLGIGILVVEVLLAFRLWFQMAGANAGTTFVNFIYDVTDPLTAPFRGVFATRTIGQNGVFEPGVVLAMVLYLVAALVLIWLVNALTAIPATAGERRYRSRETRIRRR